MNERVSLAMRKTTLTGSSEIPDCEDYFRYSMCRSNHVLFFCTRRSFGEINMLNSLAKNRIKRVVRVVRSITKFAFRS